MKVRGSRDLSEANSNFVIPLLFVMIKNLLNVYNERDLERLLYKCTEYIYLVKARM